MSNWLARLGTDSITRTNALLMLLGLASLVLYRLGLRANGADDIKWFIKLALVQAVIFLLASWLTLRAHNSRLSLLLVIAFAVLFRLALLFSPPYLSDDIYRYIWDGRVQAAGINPYRYVPAAPELAQLRDDKIYPKINRKDYAHTIYPPVTQVVFFLTTRISESVTWMKLTILTFEIIALWAIGQLLVYFAVPRQRLLLYAWHPLIVWELAGSGHVDAVSIAFIALAFLALVRRAQVLAGFSLAAGALVKLFPIVLLPALYRRWSWKTPLVFAITIVVAYLPYLSVGPGVLGYLPGYAKEEKLIGGEQFYVLAVGRRLFDASMPTAVFIIFVLVVMGAITVWILVRKTNHSDTMKAGMILATATTVLFAPHYSWYFAWLVPFLCFVPLVSLFYLTAASFLLYGSWLGDTPDEMFRLNSYLYLPFVLIGIVEFVVRRRSSKTTTLKETIDKREG